MDLSLEDALRVNVLIAGSLEAVRIDESHMILHALSSKGEASIKLNPNCRDDTYLRRVRETLSSHALGSPGGYPVYLKRWTRMGQARDQILESLLLLGEPEAVVAVVNADGITNELARRAWWASQTSENARCMLRQQAVADGQMGAVLAEFLVEFLPFEEEARNQIRSVRLVLQGELIDAAVRDRLWGKGQQKNSFYVGFLQAVPDDLPEVLSLHPAHKQVEQELASLIRDKNPFAAQLQRLLSPAGQVWLDVVERVMRKPANQDVMVELMHAMASHAVLLPLDRQSMTEPDAIACRVEDLLEGDDSIDAAAGRALADLVAVLPQRLEYIRAMLFIALLNEPILNPVFSRTDAIGTVMRKKLRPVTEPVHEQMQILRNS